MKNSPATPTHPGMRIAIIGGGVCGLTAALRLAERGIGVELFEAASQPGGRTRSFRDSATDQWCDNGPHLINGAYQATLQLLSDCHAEEFVSWQESLTLPLWDAKRGHFTLAPSKRLPFSLALLLAVRGMPGHDWRSALAMLRLQRAINHGNEPSVAALMRRCRAPEALIRDMIEPICLGTMNEDLASADAASFERVLNESFASAANARLGWFNAPLQQALVEPLICQCRAVGARIHTRTSVRSLQQQHGRIEINQRSFDACIIALPAHARNRLLSIGAPVETRAIINIHLWYRDLPPLPAPFIGGIGTLGQWFFDVSSQMTHPYHPNPVLRHLCTVISNADQLTHRISGETLKKQINSELAAIYDTSLTPAHTRIIHEKRATVLVRPQRVAHAGPRIIDASESPQPGELPATIESAVQRGEKAAAAIINSA